MFFPYRIGWSYEEQHLITDLRRPQSVRDNGCYCSPVRIDLIGIPYERHNVNCFAANHFVDTKTDADILICARIFCRCRSS